MHRSGNKARPFPDLLAFLHFLVDNYERFVGCSDVLAQGDDDSFGNGCLDGGFGGRKFLIIDRMHASTERGACFNGRSFHSLSPSSSSY